MAQNIELGIQNRYNSFSLFLSIVKDMQINTR